MKSYQNYRQHKLQQGFTLVELLVVISIIALLLSITMPALSRAREVARRVVCMSNSRTLGLANEAYASSNDGIYVPNNLDIGDWPNNREFRRNVGLTSGADQTWDFPAEYRCPSDRREDAVVNGYEYIHLSYGYNHTPFWRGTADQNSYVYSVGKIVRPSEKIQFMCSIGWRVSWSDPRHWERYGDLAWYDLPDSSYHGSPTYRHNGRTTVVYFDGRVDSGEPEDFYFRGRGYINKLNSIWYPDPSVIAN